MTVSLLPLLRQAAACASRVLSASASRFAVVVAIFVAVAGSAHAATPFEVRVTGSGPDVLLIPGLAPTLVMGTWIAYKDVATLEETRAVYERQYRTLAGVRIAMSPVRRHFIMLDDPAWFETTLQAFIK
jgi:hypothetical protein